MLLAVPCVSLTVSPLFHNSFWELEAAASFGSAAACLGKSEEAPRKWLKAAWGSGSSSVSLFPGTPFQDPAPGMGSGKAAPAQGGRAGVGLWRRN